MMGQMGGSCFILGQSRRDDSAILFTEFEPIIGIALMQATS